MLLRENGWFSSLEQLESDLTSLVVQKNSDQLMKQ